ncbi:MAG: DMT family transporter [Anaerolineae bacterium]|nr:DMT family transporter [Anaerolineae bacterium]
MDTKKSTTRIKTDLLMLLVALIWGSAFSFQQVASRHVGAFLILGFRFLGASLILLFVLRFRLSIPRRYWGKTVLVGMLLFIASTFQQVALPLTSVRNAGFITGMYVVFIPIFLSLFWRNRLKWNVWLAVALVLAGLYLLTANGGAALQRGDALLLACAILYALQMIFLSQLVRVVNPVHIAAGQFLVCGTAGMFMSTVFETNTMAGFTNAVGPLLFITVFSTAIAYTLQGVAQKTAEPTDAAIFLSMESVFAALVGAWWLDETLNWVQAVGCFLMFSAMVLSQVHFPGSKPVKYQANRQLSRSPGIPPQETIGPDQPG